MRELVKEDARGRGHMRRDEEGQEKVDCEAIARYCPAYCRYKAAGRLHIRGEPRIDGRKACRELVGSMMGCC